MFEPITPSSSSAPLVQFTFNGEKFKSAPGMTVAAALLAANQSWFRKSAVSSQLRGPYCMMGTCYECLVEIDGISVQACMTQISEGLQVRSVPEVILDEAQVK